MGKNIIPLIAKKLGVAVGEEFSLKGYTEERFKFENTLLLRYDQEDRIWRGAAYEVLGGLIYGSFEVDKLPFEPKDGEEYWTYVGDHNYWEIGCEVWVDAPYDYIHKACGCVFRSKEEALAARPIKFKELTGREWQE